MTVDGRFAFMDEPKVFDAAEPTVVARIGQADSKESLLRELAAQLQFPMPYGGNWDALEEMLRRFEWTDARSVLIVHEDVPRLSPGDLDTYLAILRGANAFWQQRGDRSLLAVFPASARAGLQRMSGLGP